MELAAQKFIGACIAAALVVIIATMIMNVF